MTINSNALSALTAAVLLLSSPLSANCEDANAGFSENRDGENALDLEDYKRAEDIYRGQLSTKSDGSKEGYNRTCLGESLLWQGRFSEAGKELKKAYSLIDKSQPAASDLRARVLDDQAWLAESKQDNASALKNCRAGLDALKGVSDVPTEHICGLLEHLGSLLKDAGLYAEASKYYQQSLDIRSKTYGATSVQVADDMEMLSVLSRKLGNISQANALYGQALQIKSSSPALFSAYAPHAYFDTVTYNYCPGTPNCGVTAQHGYTRVSVNINGLTVSATLMPPNKQLDKNTCVDVTVINQSPYPVQFLPKAPVLNIMEPKVALSQLVNADALANKIEKKGDKSAKWVRFWGADATMPVTTTYIGRPGYWGYAPVTSFNGTYPTISRSGNMTTVTSQIPDYAAQARALQKAADIQDTAREQAQTVRGSSIGASTIQPGGNVSGSLYFDGANVQKALLQLPVGNGEFDFLFPPPN